MSKSLLIYPYSSETSDILRNKSFRERYEVIHLCAFPGSGLERKDAGDVDRGGHIGIMVEEDYDIAIKVFKLEKGRCRRGISNFKMAKSN